MFSVIFEVQPKSEQWDAYLGTAKMLRPELEKVDGFVDNIRYKSLTREGWILSLSGWRDEKSVVRWRVLEGHHLAQEKGRSEILRGYHLRVGQITQDTRVPVGHKLVEQRLDETEVGEGSTIALIDVKRPSDLNENATANETAARMGLDEHADGLVAWDVYDAVLTPGDLMLMTVWRSQASADKFGATVKRPNDSRLRQVRVVRDYGMHDRREAPQFYPDIAKT
jgi:heme-degrading monooxygenase HmoA